MKPKPFGLSRGFPTRGGTPAESDPAALLGTAVLHDPHAVRRVGRVGRARHPPDFRSWRPARRHAGPLLALNVAMCALPVTSFVLILIGVSRMMMFVPSVGAKLVWRIGDHYVTAVMLAAFILIGYLALFAIILAVALLEYTGTAIDPLVGLAGELVAAAIPVALGWYLMLLSGWSLSRIAEKTERILALLAVGWAGAFAALLIAAETIATFVLGSAALSPGAHIPARVPWADAASGVAGFAALVVLTVIARRASLRYASKAGLASAQPA